MATSVFSLNLDSQCVMIKPSTGAGKTKRDSYSEGSDEAAAKQLMYV